jgi:hypothetical protein
MPRSLGPPFSSYLREAARGAAVRAVKAVKAGIIRCNQ